MAQKKKAVKAQPDSDSCNGAIQEPAVLPEPIRKTPGVCGGEPTVAGTRVTVRGLVEAQRAGFSDEQLLTEFPFLTQHQLDAAWRYAQSHPEEIEGLIEKNRSSA